MLICTPVKTHHQKEAVSLLKKLKGKVNLAEIWLDQIRDLELKKLIKESPLPVIAVVKRPSDKGLFKGTYKQMAELLTQADLAGAKYVDFPDSMPTKAFPRARKAVKKAKIIISHHDFKKTPALKNMLSRALKMRRMGADIVKIAVNARSHEDTFTVIALAQLLQAEKIPHILIAMGEKGKLSRILTPHLGGTIMFAPISNKGSTAKGQLTVKELKYAWSLIKK